jgi:hypothetical protein
MDGSTTLGVLFGLGLGAASCLVVAVNGQTRPAPTAFEASIREHVSGGDNASVRAQPSGRSVSNSCGGGASSGAFGTASQAATSSDSVSLSTAVREQLGLKLDAQRGPVAVLVIESAQRPLED